MIVLGITGGIGSGKSTITEIFRLMNIPVYIADVESKKLTSSSPIIKKKLINLFGEDLYSNGDLDKKKLASLIFTNEDNLKRVNEIIHPEVKKDFEKWAQIQSKKHTIIAHEAAILFESGFNKFMDKTITVYTPLETRIARTIKRDKVSRENVLERIANQMSDEEKIKLSDYIIYNDEQHSLIEQVEDVISDLNKNNNA